MTFFYKEAEFPLHYRRAEVGQIVGALSRLRSVSIHGLAGMGKSNIVRFLVSHPRVLPHYLPERAQQYVLLHLDCSGLAECSESEILTEVAIQLQEKGLVPVLPPLASEPGRARRDLRDRILRVDPGLHLVVVLDDFDHGAATLGRAFFNYLAHLRNARPKGNMLYVFVTRRALGPLHELAELLDDACVIGPLDWRDTRDSLRRDGARLGYTFADKEEERLHTLTGGHPGALKNVAELVACGAVDLARAEDEVTAQLLRSAKVRRTIEELWQDLTESEQEAVSCVVRGLPLPLQEDDPAARLTAYGVLVESTGGPDAPHLRPFCPLLEAFVRARAKGDGPICLTPVVPNRVRIKGRLGREEVTLSPLLFELLLALVQARGEAVSIDELIWRVYGDEAAGASNAALSQLVKRLRDAVDPQAQKVSGDAAYSCVETLRGVGYRLAG
ncbi:MAG: winged helix-turn-helix domain-containing protein [Anaerolineae bacterium]